MTRDLTAAFNSRAWHRSFEQDELAMMNPTLFWRTTM
jgi:hypothetical protein